ncbi:MAG: hypothetical protein JWR26_3363 [Pedosphaera sp.]|nr:hypothetical protein [Pedosphaera sp.]
MNTSATDREWDESTSAPGPLLKHTGAVFESLFDRSADAIWLFELCDARTAVLADCNQAAVELVGAENKQQVLGTKPEDHSPPVQPDGSRSAEGAAEIIAIVQRQKKHRFEWVMRRLDGRDVPIEASATAVAMGGKNFHVIISRDISEHKKAERELLELAQALERRVTERTAALSTSEARFRALVEHASEAIVVFDGDTGRFLFGNEHACRLYRVPMKKLVGLTPADVSPEFQPGGLRSSELALEKMDQALAGGMPVFEWIHRQPDGKLVPTEVRLLRLPDEGRNLIRASIVDTTERKRAERAQAALAESEARFSAAFQASPVFIGVLRLSDGKFVLANDALVNWLGCPRSEALGQSCADLGMWEHIADRALVWEELGTLGSIRQKECRWRNRRGELFTVLLSAEMITLDNSPHVLLLALDITRRKQAEVEMLRLLAREKELSQLRSNFVSMVSHEFRTPLGIIQSSAELLREFFPKMPPGERDEQLESITRNTRRMAGMMEDILILSRLDAGKLEFQPAALDVNIFCCRVVDEVLSATNRRCLIELSLGSVLPESEADERLLGHIFTNLLSNAVKYSEPGATVRFTVERDGRDAVCVVRDQGIGISEEDQQQLFKAFHRGSNVGSRPGTGLGLLLVKRCAELHGGKVRVTSRVGEGTTVTVWLPVFGKNHEKDTGH